MIYCSPDESILNIDRLDGAFILYYLNYIFLFIIFRFLFSYEYHSYKAVPFQ